MSNSLQVKTRPRRQLRRHLGDGTGRTSRQLDESTARRSVRVDDDPGPEATTPLRERPPSAAAVIGESDRVVPLVSPDLPHTDPNPRPHRTRALRRVRRLGAFLFGRRWRITRHGLANIPPTGPVILAANHVGVIDGPLLVAMSPRTTFALAKSELFSGRLGSLLTWLGQIPIARHYVDTHAIRRSVHVLRSKHCLAIFPEGVRNRGDLTSIRGGAAYLAMVTGAPIVPVALLGTRQPGQSVKDLPEPGSALHIVYGEPIAISQVPWPRRKADVAVQTEYVRRRLQAHLIRAQEITGMELPGDPAQPVPAASA